MQFNAPSFSCKLDVRVALFIQFNVVVEPDDTRPDGILTLPTLPLLFLGGPLPFPSQGQLLIPLLPHELFGTDGLFFVISFKTIVE